MNPTIKYCLGFASSELKLVDSGNLIALRLLGAVMAVPPSYLWAHPEVELTADQLATFKAHVSRAANHEPLAYILGYADFYGYRFQVDQRVLIPRPETEALVDVAVDFAKRRGSAIRQKSEVRSQNYNSKFRITHPVIETRKSKIENPSLPSVLHTPDPVLLDIAPLRIVDIATGSGCLAISIAKQLPEAEIYATDLSPEALEVAQSNAYLLDAAQVTFLLGSLAEPLAGLLGPHSIDVMVANLPYISDDEFEQLPATVRDFEPALALRSGPTPDKLNTKLVAQAAGYLKPGGLLAYETTNGRIITKLF
jgi:release factor glutamine methyltransferase